MHQEMDVNVAQTKGHRQRDPVRIGQDLIDQKLSSLHSIGIFKNLLPPSPGANTIVKDPRSQLRNFLPDYFATDYFFFAIAQKK
jgi:hypothetical protein